MNGLAVCAGIDGIELGLRTAIGPAYRTVCYIEREAHAAALLVARMADGAVDEAPIWSDLTSFDGRFWRGAVDIVSAGIPCQPFSCAGKRRGVADERYLWPYLWRCVRDVGAWCLLLENVPGIIPTALPLILGDLAASGWAAEWDVFSAAGVGAPHLRKRLFLLAHAGGAGTGLEESHAAGQGWQPAGTSQPAILRCRDGAGDAEGPDAGGADVADAAGLQFRGQPPAGDHQARPGRPLADAASRQRRTAEPGESRHTGNWWATEPAVGCVADGVPYRVDRLRALGNAVVPLVAAVAFRVLAERLGE